MGSETMSIRKNYNDYYSYLNAKRQLEATKTPFKSGRDGDFFYIETATGVFEDERNQQRGQGFYSGGRAVRQEHFIKIDGKNHIAYKSKRQPDVIIIPTQQVDGKIVEVMLNINQHGI